MSSVAEILRERAGNRGSDRAFVFLDEGTTVTYAELDAAARRIASAVTANGGRGKPVLLLYPPGRAYVEGFFGCLYSGAIAVPAYPPDPARLNRTLPRLRALTADCGARLALTMSWLTEAVPEGLDWVATDNLAPIGDHDWAPPPDGAPALLQYTSGSTGEPKGVLLSQTNLLHNAELVRTGFGASSTSVGVSWLPPYHDMGLIGGIVQPVYAGMPVILLSPLTFLDRPMVWLETISRYEGTVSGGPNFAFDLCVRKSTPTQRAELDLSSWSVAFSGAEPVRAETLDRFAEAFAPAGFRRAAFYPCYGLAEGTLIVTGGSATTPPHLVRRDRVTHVGCGAALGDQVVLTVDPDTATRTATGEEGEIWVSGPSVATGYWNRPEETEHTFRARLAGDPRRYLRTGDLGFLDHGGELVVTGRTKDLIVLRGRNVYPQDLELSVERVTGVRPGCCAAFATELDGEERVTIACEVSPGTPETPTLAAIRRVLAEDHEVHPAAVVLLAPRSIPKTSSGKIQRHACREAFSGGRLEELGRWEQVPTEAVTQLAGLRDAAPDTPLTELGLDSVRAIELRHALRDRLGLDVAVAELLGGITVAELTRRPPVREEPVVAEPDVSDGQRALWFLQQWAPDSTVYQITRAARIRSPLDVEALDRALRALVRRHPALRTRLPARNGVPVREVFDWDGPVLERRDLATLDQDARRRFDLERGPLLRVSLYSPAPDDHVLLLSVHHVIADFWSLTVLVDELVALYSAETAGVPAWLPEPAVHTPTRSDLGPRLDYWRATLAGAPPALALPTTFPRPPVQSFRGGAYDFRIEPGTLRALDEFAKGSATTRFTTLLAVFAALLSRYAGEDLVIGMPVAGRDDPHTAGQVGYLVNQAPVRVRVEQGDSLRGLVSRVRQTVLGALAHAVPFARIVEALRPNRDPSRSPMTQVMLTLQQSPPNRADLAAFAVADESARLRVGGLDVRPHRLARHDAAFDLALTVAEVDGGLSGVMEYCADLFDESTVARMCDQFTTLVTKALRDPSTPVATIELMDDAERATVLAWADGGPPAPQPPTLPALFARQVSRRGDAPSVVFCGQTLSYAELDARASRLAGALHTRFGVRRGSRVGVRLPRGIDWIVSFWAVLKAGGVYLPLPPDLPANRLKWMIADGCPTVLLGERELAETMRERGAVTEPIVLSPDDLAYVLYTSGSTGRPKGVLVAHGGVVNVAEVGATTMEVAESDRVLQFASSSFDTSILEILVAHLRGAVLHIAPPELVPGPDLVRMLGEQRITAAILSPSVVATLPDAELPELSRLVVGGEACPAALVTRWGQGRRFINAYGPTETSVCVTFADLAPDGSHPPIGRPHPGIRTYVLDGRLRPVPVGLPGELYIGGVGVAHGYLGRPDLTAQRFVPDPFVRSGRMYRTGDRVRWRPDGMLDFLGRADQQVQIRGVRVEPGEAEARLRELFGLREVAVVPRQAPGGGTELVAYLVSQGIPVARLRDRLRAELPGPLMPSAFVFLDRLPLTPSGKLDRSALPEPSLTDRGAAGQHTPNGELERVVAEVWAAVLGQDSVGVRHHFFDELGGTSLLVARVTSALGDRLGRHLPVTDLFEHPTVEALARHLSRATPEPETTRPQDHAAARKAALARRTRADRRDHPR